ncbi:MAG TPA: hypothetical protein VK979_09570 [Guyparkeria sp.]|nr:hypothetical protein [Guyparkeria sp.]
MKRNLTMTIGPTRQRGIGMTMILGVLAGIVVIGAVLALTARNGSNSPLDKANEALVGGLLSEAANMRMGFDFMQSNGVTADNITFDKTATTGLFHPTDGGTVEFTPPAELLENTSASWQMRGGRFPGVGTDSGTDKVVALAEISQSACQMINDRLYSSSSIPVLSSVDANGSWWGSSSSVLVDLSGEAGIDGRAATCLETSDGVYVYYSTLAEG